MFLCCATSDAATKFDLVPEVGLEPIRLEAHGSQPLLHFAICSLDHVVVFGNRKLRRVRPLFVFAPAWRNSPQTPLPLFLCSNGTGTEAGGQKFLPPNPLPFCPPAGNPQRFFRTAGPQIGWWAWLGLVILQILFYSIAIFSLFIALEIQLNKFNTLLLFKTGINNTE